ncbi:hypothetical protein, partial [Xanthomonas euvesicatoria]|uniref:hypothetical protein n=1 Tax=Xanthomonas euvesicatoria TaxID=456327 RepID=UPI001BAE5C8F
VRATPHIVPHGHTGAREKRSSSRKGTSSVADRAAAHVRAVGVFAHDGDGDGDRARAATQR